MFANLFYKIAENIKERNGYNLYAQKIVEIWLLYLLKKFKVKLLAEYHPVLFKKGIKKKQTKKKNKKLWAHYLKMNLI